MVGINTAINPNGKGIGFAIPASTAQWVLTEILTQGRVRRAWLGIGGQTLSLPRRQRLHLRIADALQQGSAAEIERNTAETRIVVTLEVRHARRERGSMRMVPIPIGTGSRSVARRSSARTRATNTGNENGFVK